MAHLLATSFSVHLGCTRPPLPLTWEKLNKQEVRRPGTSCLPSNRPLVPRGGTEIRGLLQVLPPNSPPPLRPIQSLQDQCFGCEFCLTPFLPPEPPANTMNPLSICQLGHSAAVMSSSMPAGLLLPHTGNFYAATLHVMFIVPSVRKQLEVQ